MVYVQRITRKKVSEKNHELKVKLLTEGSNAAMIQENVSMHNKIGISRTSITDNDNNVDEDDEGCDKNATQYM